MRIHMTHGMHTSHHSTEMPVFSSVHMVPFRLMTHAQNLMMRIPSSRSGLVQHPSLDVSNLHLMNDSIKYWEIFFLMVMDGNTTEVLT